MEPGQVEYQKFVREAAVASQDTEYRYKRILFMRSALANAGTKDRTRTGFAFDKNWQDSLLDELEGLAHELPYRQLIEMQPGWALKEFDRGAVRAQGFGSFNRGGIAAIKPDLADEYLRRVAEVGQRLDDVWTPVFEAVDQCQVNPVAYRLQRHAPLVTAIVTTLTVHRFFNPYSISDYLNEEPKQDPRVRLVREALKDPIGEIDKVLDYADAAAVELNKLVREAIVWREPEMDPTSGRNRLSFGL